MAKEKDQPKGGLDKTKIKAIAKKFGVAPKSLKDWAGRKGEDLFAYLKGDTGKNTGMDWKEFASNRSDIWTSMKEPETYSDNELVNSYVNSVLKNIDTGDFGMKPKKIKKLVKDLEKQAKKYYKEDRETLQEMTDEKKSRLEEDFNSVLNETGTEYGWSEDDLARQKEYASQLYSLTEEDLSRASEMINQDFDTTMGQIERQEDIEEEGLETSLAQAGAFDSGREISKTQELQEAQEERRMQAERNRDRSMQNISSQEQRAQLARGQEETGLDLAGERGEEQYGWQQQRLQRDKDRDIYDVDDYYKQQQRNIKKQQQQLAGSLLSGELGYDQDYL